MPFPSYQSWCSPSYHLAPPSQLDGYGCGGVDVVGVVGVVGIVSVVSIVGVVGMGECGEFVSVLVLRSHQRP